MRSINREFYRFILWGGVNTLLGYVIYLSLLLFLPYLLSYTVAFIAGILISYLLNSKFVFSQDLKWSKALKYPLVYLTQYLIGSVSLYLLVQFWGLSAYLAPLVIVLLTIPITFLLSRKIVGGN